MTGREKCQFLRELRAEIARKNQITLHQEPCNNPADDCLGVCPLCERELMDLENAIAQKEREGYFAVHKLLESVMEYHRELVFADPDSRILNELYLDTPLFDDEELTGYMVYEDPDEA